MARRQAGEFDRRITIQVRSESQAAGGFGDTVVEWVEFARPWARRRALRGSERFVAQQFEAKVSVVFELRHPLPDATWSITPTQLQHDMRVVDGADTYDITGIVPAERTGGGQELHCFEHAD